jgi:hypothetical protein
MLELERVKTTAMKPEEIKRKTEQQTEQPTEEYHFSGGGEYEPMTIRATSIEEATEEWEKVRKPAGTPVAVLQETPNE